MEYNWMIAKARAKGEWKFMATKQKMKGKV
jgi:hypothetical protein